jgi:diguanylate cyclase (GGDEF)-like protein
MSKLVIFYVDYSEDKMLEKIMSSFTQEFKEYELCVQNHKSNIIKNITHALNRNCVIPIVFISDTYLDKLGNHICYEIKKVLHVSNIIFLSSSKKINNISKLIQSIGFYTFISKKYLKNNLYITISDAIKHYEMNVQIQNSYKKDVLTGLFNRNTLLKEIEKRVKPCILLINIDDFKYINYTFGYQVGDLVLKQFASHLQKHCVFCVYRLLSDEFVILFDNEDDDELYAYAQDIKHKIAQTNFIVDSEVINLTISVAISNHNTLLIENARDAIRNSMLTQKNSIVHVCAPNKSKEEKVSAKKLRQAFEEDKIIPFYQGIRNNQTRKIEKYECLVRLKDENNCLVSPQDFLPLAHSLGLMPKLTQRIIQKVFEYFANKQGEFSINLTEEDLKEHYIIEFLIQESQRHHINLNRVTFEILENIHVENSALIFEQIKELKALGCKIAFDDFGCEKSNFSRLLDLNIDIVKIDSMFIKNIHTNKKSYKLTKAITRLAKDLDCQIVAEGVECEAAQKMVELLEIDYTQGFYYSTPQENI